MQSFGQTVCHVVVLVVVFVVLPGKPRAAPPENTTQPAGRPASHNRVPQSPSDGTVADLDLPLAEILGRLPQVHSVDVWRSDESPTHRIVHIKDWHFIPEDLFVAESRAIGRGTVASQKVASPYQRFLRQVKDVQRQQQAVLRHLIRQYGLKHVHCEGLFQADARFFRTHLEALQEFEPQVAVIEQNVRELTAVERELRSAGQTESSDYRRVSDLRSQLESLLRQHQRQLLRIGAAGRLAMRGELQRILPLERPDEFRRADPLAPDGTLRDVAQKTIEAREDAQVREILSAGPFALIVLGGAHDLSNNLSRLTSARCEYIRVTTHAYHRWGNGTIAE